MRPTQFLCTLALLVGVLAPASGQQARSYLQDFEDQLPGDFPRRWHGAWGQGDDDQILITNLRAASGSRCLLLDRQTGTNLAQWGFQTNLPDITSGWLQFSFAFCMEGKGSFAHLGFELRNGRTRALSGGWRYSRVGVSGMVENVDRKLLSAPLGHFDSGSWYRLNLWLPSAPEGNTAYARLDERQPDGSYRPRGQAMPFVCEFAHGKGNQLMINLPPGLRGFRFFIDDLAWTILPAYSPPQAGPDGN